MIAVFIIVLVASMVSSFALGLVVGIYKGSGARNIDELIAMADRIESSIKKDKH